MVGIIFVLHGRKNKLSSANVSVVEKAAEHLKIPYELGLLEGMQQTLEEAIQSLLNQQVTEIVFLPVLLFPATHAKEDLPERAEKAIEKQVPYHILPTLGTTDAVEDFLVQQIHSVEDSRAEVLLVAHGTPRSPEPFQQLEQIAKKVERKVKRRVYPSNYYGDHSYQSVLKRHSEPMIIQRLFLTEEYLSKKIKNEIREQREVRDVLLPTMQDSEALVSAIIERIEEIPCIQF
ncbi:sirohydrochlorin chelatase [Candidatus Enterococcus murrayae]|uniref:Sirohydrochlorin ferrochelatase n=1 Tax=Candidatus Enterococcus murrayae TaxID=2815321 RepID=A0ABS3HCR6_9ENTE|nr:CbiX/SirB N-terminal domain-containing protein [Enterococcus sp. MJM16]MBO0451243.1 hypothetical protein [Enterococcus sp. MJM16]